jgi:lambda repressor-like predicted transcriptional regulator
MSKSDNDQYWLDLIAQCRKSGLTDRQWCLANGVSPSTFYYHIKTLRNKACDIPMIIQSEQSSHQDVVPISFIDENPVTKTKPTELAAVRISLHGMNIEILNHAEQSVIANTLLALQNLC